MASPRALPAPQTPRPPGYRPRRSGRPRAIAPACPQNPGRRALRWRDTACPPLGAPHGWVWGGGVPTVLGSPCVLLSPLRRWLDGTWCHHACHLPSVLPGSGTCPARMAARGWALLGADPMTLEGRASPAQHHGSAPSVSAGTQGEVPVPSQHPKALVCAGTSDVFKPLSLCPQAGGVPQEPGWHLHPKRVPSTLPREQDAAVAVGLGFRGDAGVAVGVEWGCWAAARRRGCSPPSEAVAKASQLPSPPWSSSSPFTSPSSCACACCSWARKSPHSSGLSPILPTRGNRAALPRRHPADVRAGHQL